MTANVEAAATSNMGPVGNDGIAADFKPFPHFLDMETGLPSAPVASGAVSGFRSRDGRSSGSTSLSSMELTAIIQALQLQDEEGAVSEERWKEKAEEDEEGSQEAAEEEAFAAEALSVVAGGGRVVAVTAAVESLCDGTAEVAVCGGQGFRERYQRFQRVRRKALPCRLGYGASLYVRGPPSCTTPADFPSMHEY